MHPCLPPFNFTHLPAALPALPLQGRQRCLGACKLPSAHSVDGSSGEPCYECYQPPVKSASNPDGWLADGASAFALNT
eukprot:250566-Chlamydomonas_euryale.AAC.1